MGVAQREVMEVGGGNERERGQQNRNATEKTEKRQGEQRERGKRERRGEGREGKVNMSGQWSGVEWSGGGGREEQMGNAK